MSLALFDLDNTLLDGDSDQLWTDFLAAQGILDLTIHGPRMAAYHGQYLEGDLDVHQYLAFSLGLISHISVAELSQLRKSYVESSIRPRIRPEARALVDKHRDRSDRLVIITLTNRFITDPIAAEFGIDTLLATEPEVVNGYLTGQVVGEPCYQQGKIQHLNRWMALNDEGLDGSYFYSDSINDLPLLEAVTYPIVVNPDPQLEAIARERGWLCHRLFADSGDTT